MKSIISQIKFCVPLKTTSIKREITYQVIKILITVGRSLLHVMYIFHLIQRGREQTLQG